MSKFKVIDGLVFIIINSVMLAIGSGMYIQGSKCLKEICSHKNGIQYLSIPIIIAGLIGILIGIIIIKTTYNNKEDKANNN